MVFIEIEFISENSPRKKIVRIKASAFVKTKFVGFRRGNPHFPILMVFFDRLLLSLCKRLKLNFIEAEKSFAPVAVSGDTPISRQL